MNVQKGKPSVSPPVQIAAQPQHLGIASVPSAGHTPPLLRTEEIQIFTPGYTQGYSTVPQAQVPHDMSKQQPVAAAPGLMPAPSLAPQQQPGIFQQPQGGALRTQSYYATSQPQGMHRPQRYMTPTQPNQMYPAMYQYMGQTKGQGYPTTANVMVQQQGQIMFQQSQRMPTPQYIPNTQLPQLAAAAATAQYTSQPTQQHGSTSQFQPVYYQPGGQVPTAQPSRPPSGSDMTTPTGTLQEQEDKSIVSTDPNSGQHVQTEMGETITTPTGGSARSTPVGRQRVEGYSAVPQEQEPHDMSKQQPVAPVCGLMPEPSVVSQQQPGLFQQKPALEIKMRMSSFPACMVCCKEFTFNGPAPFLLPCLHTVCEACVSSKSIIYCTSCNVSVNPKKTKLCKDLVRKREILQLTIKKRPEDLLCTHEDDGNKAICWCQDCEEMLCASCQSVHQSFKVTRGHTVLDVEHALPNPNAEVKYCGIHKRYPLDTYDKTCKTFICLRCLRDDHADHETIDIEKVENIYKTTFQNQLQEISSVESHEEKMLKITMTHMTSIKVFESEMKNKVTAYFQTLRHFLDEKEQKVLHKLEEQAQQCQLEAKLKKKKIVSNQAECKRVREYVTSVLGYPNLRDVLPRKAAIEDKMRGMVSTKSKVERMCSLPNFNPSGGDTLKSFISHFGDVEIIQKDIPGETVPVSLKLSSPDSEPGHLITYSRTFLLQQQFTGLSIKRPRSLTRAFPEIIPDTPFCVPEGISSGGSVVPKLPVLSKNFLVPMYGILKPQEACNTLETQKTRELQPQKVNSSGDLRKEVEDVLLLLKKSSKPEMGKTKVDSRP